MTREAFRARVGVACITPRLLPIAFETLPIGFYKDYHALGDAHRGADWAAALGDGQPYIPTIQYRSIGDTPEIRDMLRMASTTGQFPMPEGVTIDEMLNLLELSGLEAWLVQSTKDGALPDGSLFMLGTEPGYRPNHDLRTPVQIVDDARLIKDIFERNGLGHRLALGGISSPDTAYNRRAYGSTGLEFFEAILEEAARRDVTFDAFVIHPYPFNGIDDPAEYRNLSDPAALTRDSITQIRAFRSIMLRYGQRDKDVIVGEIGFPFETVMDSGGLINPYLDQILTWCLTATDEGLGNRRDENRLVQRFTWFMLTVPVDPTPGITDHPVFDFEPTLLLESDGGLTALGRTMNTVADRLAPER